MTDIDEIVRERNETVELIKSAKKYGGVFNARLELNGSLSRESTLIAMVLELEKDNAGLVEALNDANGICRSAHAIAERKGKETNWEGYLKMSDASLKRQFEVIKRHGGGHE